MLGEYPPTEGAAGTMKREPERELHVLLGDLRQLIYALADAQHDDYDIQSIKGTRVLTRSLERDRAEAWLTIMQAVLNMHPGDSLTVEWHGASERLATLMYTPAPCD